MGFKFSDIAYAANMSVDKVSIDFDNVGLTMSAILLGEDVRNKTAKLSFGCYGTMGMVWDSGIEWDAEIQWLEGTTIIGVVDLFQGIISDWNLSETMAQMTIVNEFILWKKKHLELHRRPVRGISRVLNVHIQEEKRGVIRVMNDVLL